MSNFGNFFQGAMGVSSNIQDALKNLIGRRPFAGVNDVNGNGRGSGQLVRLEQDPLNPASIYSARTLNILQSPRDMGEDAEIISVTYGYESTTLAVDPSLNGPPQYDFYGLLHWGVGGTQFTAEVDWPTGAIVTLPASFISLSCVFSDDVFLSTYDTLQLNIQASFAYGAPNGRGLSTNARRTIHVPGAVGPLAPGETSALHPVPRFAQSFTLACGRVNFNPMAAPDCLIEFYNSSTTVATSLVGSCVWNDFSNQASQNDGSFIVPPTAEFFRVTNRLGAAPFLRHDMLNLQAIFALSF